MTARTELCVNCHIAPQHPSARGPYCLCCSHAVCKCGEIVLRTDNGYPETCKFAGKSLSEHKCGVQS